MSTAILNSAPTNEPSSQAAPIAQAPQQTSSPAPEKSWYDSLPDDLKNEASLKNFTDVPSLAKSYVHLNRTARSEKIPKPNQYFTDDDWKETFKALGLPESVDKYEVKVPDGTQVDNEMFSKLKEQAHAAGILPKQFEKLFGSYIGIASEKAKQTEAQRALEQQSVIEGLKKEWGQAFDREVYAAQLAVKEFGGEQLQKALMDKGLANDPDLIRVFAKIGKSLKEDAVKNPTAPGFNTKTPEEAMREANAMLGDFNHPLHKRDHPNHEQAIKDLNRLFEMANPS